MYIDIIYIYIDYVHSYACVCVCCVRNDFASSDVVDRGLKRVHKCIKLSFCARKKGRVYLESAYIQRQYLCCWKKSASAFLLLKKGGRIT